MFFIDEDEIVIKCKEDLINTYIENDFGELRDLYVKKAIELGFAHQGYVDRKCDWYNLNFVGICNGWSSVRLGQTNDASEELKKHECRELTLSDLKPKRTRTEYEKVTESIFDLRDEFERGELYNDNLGINKINSLTYMAASLESGSLYRKVEKEIDERQEFIDKTYYLAQSCGAYDAEEVAGIMYDAGCRFQD